MAHVTVGWTDNLEGEIDIVDLLRTIARQMREQADGAFPVGGIRVRAIKLADYVIADDSDPRCAFIDVNVKMGIGRDADFIDWFFEGLFTRLVDGLGPLFDSRPLALSLYVHEVDGWKHNSIHHFLEANRNAAR